MGVKVGVIVGGRSVAVGEDVAVGVGVLKRTSLIRVGSRLGSDWLAKLPQARIVRSRMMKKLRLKIDFGVQSLL
jgi:hypothetical protein